MTHTTLLIFLLVSIITVALVTGNNDNAVNPSKSVKVFGERGYAIVHKSSTATQIFFVFDDKRLQLVSQSGNLVSCTVGIDDKKLDNLLFEATVESLAKLDTDIPEVLQSESGKLESFENLLSKCHALKQHHIRARRNTERSRYTIFPGTKWCGNGNVGAHENDFGPEIAPDRCCHTHDRCEMHINGYSKKYGYKNTGPFTVNHCSCDDEFQLCLRAAGTTISNEVGRWFFNIIQMKCFIVEDKFGCVEWYISNVWCKKYGYSKSAVIYAPQHWSS